MSTGVGNNFDVSDEESQRGEFEGSGKWSSSNSSLSLSVENEATTPQAVTKQKLLDPKLVDFLVEHQDEMTLDTIQAMHELLSELKSTRPDSDTVEHISDLKARYFAQKDSDYLRKELDDVRKTKRLIEHKLQHSRKIHKEELQLINETKFDNLLKTNGALEYKQALDNCKRIGEEGIKELKSELKRLREEVEYLRDRRTQLTKEKNHFEKLLQASEASKSALERQTLNNDRMLDLRSPASSFDDGHVPPPPLLDAPPIEEIFENAKTPPSISMHSFNSNPVHHDSLNISSPNNSQFSIFNNSIPPPPMEEVDLDEIFKSIRRN